MYYLVCVFTHKVFLKSLCNTSLFSYVMSELGPRIQVINDFDIIALYFGFVQGYFHWLKTVFILKSNI